jgi:hypothetical protein
MSRERNGCQSLVREEASSENTQRLGDMRVTSAPHMPSAEIVADAYPVEFMNVRRERATRIELPRHSVEWSSEFDSVLYNRIAERIRGWESAADGSWTTSARC